MSKIKNIVYNFINYNIYYKFNFQINSNFILLKFIFLKYF